eukprot:12898985-Prorocentrum_lima.AAC.1
MSSDMPMLSTSSLPRMLSGLKKGQGEQLPACGRTGSRRTVSGTQHSAMTFGSSAPPTRHRCR